MKVKPSSLFECLHLDPNYMSLTAQNLMVISESFNLLDVQGDELLNGSVFQRFIHLIMELCIILPPL